MKKVFVNLCSLFFLFVIAADASAISFVQVNGSGCNEHTANANLQIGIWNHIAAVLDDTANVYQIYLNSTLLASQLETTALIPNSQNLTLGRTAFGENWNGLLDEVRIYNRALNQSEIQTDTITPLP